MPPVAKNFIPIFDAINIVLATVVAAFSLLYIDNGSLKIAVIQGHLTKPFANAIVTLNWSKSSQ